MFSFILAEDISYNLKKIFHDNRFICWKGIILSKIESIQLGDEGWIQIKKTFKKSSGLHSVWFPSLKHFKMQQHKWGKIDWQKL